VKRPRVLVVALILLALHLRMGATEDRISPRANWPSYSPPHETANGNLSPQQRVDWVKTLVNTGIVMPRERAERMQLFIQRSIGYAGGDAALKPKGRSMKISVKQTGGFAGEINLGAVDTAQLDTAEAQQVEQLVQNIGFFELPATIGGGKIGADLARYEITVTEGDRQHTIAFQDDGSPEHTPLRRLVQIVSQRGQR
jgi:hypothetical protein